MCVCVNWSLRVFHVLCTDSVRCIVPPQLLPYPLVVRLTSDSVRSKMLSPATITRRACSLDIIYPSIKSLHELHLLSKTAPPSPTNINFRSSIENLSSFPDSPLVYSVVLTFKPCTCECKGQYFATGGESGNEDIEHEYSFCIKLYVYVCGCTNAVRTEEDHWTADALPLFCKGK